MKYSLVKSLLFRMDAELSHKFTLHCLKQFYRLGFLSSYIEKPDGNPKEVFGIKFQNPIGLAAGVDKNGDYIDALGALGFGFIEIGTVTPRPQDGNPKPRLFRLEGKQAIINRMGFNNKGVEYLIARVKAASYQGILGINIGKNADTPLERALDDYTLCMYKVYPHAHYITVNISSPNTPGLRTLQKTEYLDHLVSKLKEHQDRLAHEHGKYVPVVIKIAPDVADEEIEAMAGVFLAHQVDGIIATNTTLDRKSVIGLPNSDQAGGLSGEPLFVPATLVLQKLAAALEGKIPLIASGGIMTSEHAKAKLNAGAQLVQLYTGLVYRGPDLIAECIKASLNITN